MTIDCVDETNAFFGYSKLNIHRLKHVSYFAQSYNVPGLSMGFSTQYTALSNKPHPGNKVSFNDFFVTFIVDEDFTNYLEIYNWIKALGHNETLYDYKQMAESLGIMSDMSIQLMTNKRATNKVLTMIDAFPYTITDIMLDNNDSSGPPITATAGFKYENWTMK